MTKQKLPVSWAKTRDILTTKEYIKHIREKKLFKMGKIVKKFKYWVISENLFPYTKEIFKTDHVLWYAGDKDKIEEHAQEYEKKVIPYIHKNYDAILENTKKNKNHNSIHYHLFSFTMYSEKELK